MHLRPLPHLRALLPSLSVATFALVNTAAIAQTAAPTSSPPVPVAADEPIQLQKVIVTGTPMERTLFDLATPASVLTDRELAVRLQPTLGETLNTLPGVGSTSFGPNASRPVIRGLDGDHIRILENGVGLIDASATSVDHAVGTDLPDQIEQDRIAVRDGVVVKAPQITRRRLGHVLAFSTHSSAVIHATDQMREGAASVRQHDVELWIFVHHTAKHE